MNTNNTRSRMLVAAVLLCTAGVPGVGTSLASASNTRGGSGGRLSVVTTVSPITSIVSSVAGGLVDIHGLIPEGTNSHTFEPPPSAAATLAGADVLFVNGLKLEDPTEDLAKENLPDGSPIVELGSKTISERQYLYDFSFPKDGGKPNPHLWTNPPYAKRYARIAADTLQRLDPDHKKEYEDNYRTFAATVDEFDQAMKTATASMDPEQRKLLTYHDAYAYFALHYGWDVIGAVQISSFEDPTPKEVARLIAQVRKQGVQAIFGSEVFPSPVLEQIGKEAGVRYVDELRDDDLPGEPGDTNHSWLGLMKFDFVTMVKSLGGDTAALDAVKVQSAKLDTADYPQ
jgi:ABC-type Zn uptake system ZnuABC Zn-binding protein ZnuA